LLTEAPRPQTPVVELLAELDARGPEQALAEAGAERYAHPELVQQLIYRSHSLRFSDPRRMLDAARLALSLALQCTPQACGNAARQQDLQGLAWSQFATALRINSQLREADEAGERGLACLKQGTGDPVLRMNVFLQIATIHQFHRRFAQAVDMLRAAGTIAREVGDSSALATSLVQEAISTIYAGETESAVRLINQAIPLIDQELDPYLLLFACHNLVRCYIDLDRPEQALALHAEFRELYREIKDEIVAIKVAWQEGQLLRDLGHPQAAETSLLRARDGFLQRGTMFEAALVSLDLAAVYIRLGRVEDVQRTVETAIPVFRALGVEREELAALLQLQQVAGQQQRALELIRYLNSRIQPDRRDEVLK
jgi:tetratricopeptide (TPR) repeat protein